MYDYYAYSDDCEYYAAYTYDANGNITSIDDSIDSISYGYDSQNQLIRENDPYEGKTVIWEYDSAGNILSRKEYPYTTGTLGNPISTTTYTYADSDWGDLLTGYDGKTITYDNIGNMLTYGSKRFTWEHGRELASLYDGTATWNYTYDADGMRTGRRSGSTAYTYVYSGSQLTQMTVGSNILRFTYEPDGKPFTVTFNGVVYYYVTNPQGDVVNILDKNGSCVVSYYYDAWGNPLTYDNPAANSVGALNPLRYRGYVYDTETGLYYVSSRYYDPEIGRWINADDSDVLGIELGSLLHYNLFVYCWNNPVNMTDDNGYLPWFVAAAVGGALFDTAAYLIGSAISGQEITWAGVGNAALTGAVTGVAFGALGKGVKAITSAAKATKTASKFADAGIRIINKKYANKFFKLTGNLAKKYGKGIKFNKYGFPDFSRFAKYTTKIKGLTGNYAKDAAMANKIFGLKVTPRGYTWHHVEDGVTMILIPTDLHQAVRHTGGAALIKSLFGG